MAWKGDSRRHGLARKGIKTRIAQNKRFDVSKYVADGKTKVRVDKLENVMGKMRSPYAQGLWSSFKEKVKGVGAKIKEKFTPSEEVREAKARKKKAKEELKIAKQETKRVKLEAKKQREKEKLEKEMANIESEKSKQKGIEMDRASDIGEKPPIEEIDINEQGRLGALASKIERDERDVPPEQLMDLPEEAFLSPDADAIIEVSENTEKLMAYANELEHDIGQLEIEGRRLRREFEANQRKLSQSNYNEKRKAHKEAEAKIKLLKMSSLPEDKKKFEIEKIRIEAKDIMAQRDIDLYNMRDRDEATLRYAREFSNDLKKLHGNLDRRIRSMTAGGVRKRTATYWNGLTKSQRNQMLDDIGIIGSMKKYSGRSWSKLPKSIQEGFHKRYNERIKKVM